MHAVVRWLFISLLVLALPLRGLAAVGMLGCAPTPGGGHSPVQVDGAAVAPSPLHQDHAQHAHGDHHEAADPRLDHDGEAKSLKCTQCAPCCAAVAPPAVLQGLTPVDNAVDHQLGARTLALGDEIDRLERPPRGQAA